MFSTVSLRSWLCLLVIYSLLKPAVVGDPRIPYQSDRPTSTSGDIGAMYTRATPTPTVQDPIVSFYHPTSFPPPSRSPRAKISKISKQERPTNGGMPVFNIMKTISKHPTVRAVRVFIVHVECGALWAIHRLPSPLAELSAGLMGTRVGGKISTPPCTWLNHLPPSLPIPLTRTTSRYVPPTHTTDLSIPAIPRPGHEWQRGHPFDFISQNGRALGCWILTAAMSLLVAVYKIRVLSHPPARAPLTAVEWAPIAEASWQSEGRRHMCRMRNLVSVKTQTATYITVPGQPQRPLFYRSDWELEHTLKLDVDRRLDRAMDQAMSEIRYSTAYLGWFPRARKLGAMIDVCVKVTTSYFVVERDEFGQLSTVNGQRHVEHSFCVRWERPPLVHMPPVDVGDSD